MANGLVNMSMLTATIGLPGVPCSLIHMWEDHWNHPPLSPFLSILNLQLLILPCYFVGLLSFIRSYYLTSLCGVSLLFNRSVEDPQSLLHCPIGSLLAFPSTCGRIMRITIHHLYNCPTWTFDLDFVY